MECEFSERVSQLIDEELAADEVALLREHLKTCSVCKRTEKVFLDMRRQIKTEESGSWPFNSEPALRKILDSQRMSLWRRTIAVPVPVMAALLIALFTLGLWLASLRSRYPVVGSAKVKTPGMEGQQPEQGGFDLSHFDHGERAAIIKIKREQASSVNW